MKKIFFVVFACVTLSLQAQVLPPVNCDDAVLVCDSIVTQDTIKVAGTTSADEISNNSCLPHGEVRGTWYKFGVNATGNLRFLITPLDTTVDFDWALFNTSWNPCTDIFGAPSYEVSCNASGIGGGNYTTGATGLVQQGHNSAINVTTPSVFYLYLTTTIDYINDTNVILGYTIDFSGSDFNLAPCGEIGVEKIDELKINVYPNPATNILQIGLVQVDVNTNIRLYDVNGKVILAVQPTDLNTSLNISHLASGMYILEVQNSKEISRKKILKY